jgi:hypothetical protein
MKESLARAVRSLRFRRTKSGACPPALQMPTQSVHLRVRSSPPTAESRTAPCTHQCGEVEDRDQIPLYGGNPQQWRFLVRQRHHSFFFCIPESSVILNPNRLPPLPIIRMSTRPSARLCGGKAKASSNAERSCFNCSPQSPPMSQRHSSITS